MQIEMIEKGELKTIYIRQQSKHTLEERQFLEMLNHFDKFVHEMPLWQNSIVRAALINSMHDYDLYNQKANASSATLGS